MSCGDTGLPEAVQGLFGYGDLDEKAISDRWDWVRSRCPQGDVSQQDRVSDLYTQAADSSRSRPMGKTQTVNNQVQGGMYHAHD